MPDEASIPPDSTSSLDNTRDKSPQAADTQAPPSEPVTPPEVSETVPESTPEPSSSAQGSGGTQQVQPEPVQSSSPAP